MDFPAPLPRSDLAERAFDRASGAPLVPGNTVRVLLDAQENYPAWLEAIRSAQRSILFENYIIEEDEVGLAFAEELAGRARAGVKVRLIRDWLGSRAGASRRLWSTLEEAGVQLRVFNPPSLASPLGWVSRDHRKMVAVDGRVGFVSGLCVSKRWLGDPERRIAPWRDTGVELHGPAVAWIERAFKEVWDLTGAPLPAEELSVPHTVARAGAVSVRIVAGQPTSSGLFRLDQMIAAAAQRTLWLTDAYFVGFVPYVQALRVAARDGVDIRLLVPSTTDLPLISALSRSGYRPLLEAGVRVFEWNGSMLHAKTAVADGRWARVGSSNLNLASFVGNYELDVAIEDPTIARTLEDVYLRDLANSTEITLSGHRRVQPLAPRDKSTPKGSGRPPVGAVRFVTAVSAAAASGTRALGAVERGIELAVAGGLLVLATVGFLWPAALAYPLAVLGVWLAITLMVREHRHSRQRKIDEKASPPGQAPRAAESGSTAAREANPD
ncbi:phospholipase D-like domain-containing protein [Hyalangium sp.]|uniref:phospholipase D-like domain-containing protein n=1 Tax=Hyalangium sp. TaxID=2028555 RepID=UPI002D311419|nr:phospholipase D-like domain-containing protein [Hyalangium sp.]HYI01307.1 phospholipase D-like domain-containing protein [Hyalangium sp.]